MKPSRNNTMMFGALITSIAAFSATPASAQATRTWVSGVGDDVNPCSRTAPCKTFAGAISKTAAGGEINCLDPGGFGTLTITKSITIDCTGTLGSVLNSGGINGFVINDSASGSPGTSEVKLRNVQINGAGTTPGLNGIRFISGRSLIVENVFIINQKSGAGLSIQPSARASVLLNRVTIADGGTGILVQPTGAAGNAAVTLTHVTIQNNTTAGLRLDTTGNTSITGTGIAISDSTFSGSTSGIIVVETAGNSNADVTVNRSTVANNSVGVTTAGSGTATVRVGQSLIMGNGTGVQPAGSGSVRSYGNNMVDGNTAPGVFTAPTLPQI